MAYWDDESTSDLIAECGYQGEIHGYTLEQRVANSRAYHRNLWAAYAIERMAAYVVYESVEEWLYALPRNAAGLATQRAARQQTEPETRQGAYGRYAPTLGKQDGQT